MFARVGDMKCLYHFIGEISSSPSLSCPSEKTKKLGYCDETTLNGAASKIIGNLATGTLNGTIRKILWNPKYFQVL